MFLTSHKLVMQNRFVFADAFPAFEAVVAQAVVAPLDVARPALFAFRAEMIVRLFFFTSLFHQTRQ